MGAQDLLVAVLALAALAWLVARARRRRRGGACPGCDACPAPRSAGTVPAPAQPGGLVGIEPPAPR